MPAIRSMTVPTDQTVPTGQTVPAPADEKRIRVLIVEDEPLVSDLLADVLTKQGFAVQAAWTASEALRHLAAEPRVDILLTDIDLPGGMDGAALAREARRRRPDLPVLYTTGQRACIERLEPVEGSMFLPKPFDLSRIGHLLDYLLTSKSIGH
jgi:DNA-binding response OmpR family regulator